MRPPSSFEQPAETKMSATKASSASALRVTVITLAPHAFWTARILRAHKRAGSLRSLSLLLHRAGEIGDVAAIVGRGDPDLVDGDVRRQAGDVADQVAD